jgi:HJR/Mrr/RecB family endonuclease
MERKKLTSEEEARADLGPERSRPPWRERRPLPFAELSDDEFEDYCFRLYLREYSGDRVYYYGGSHDAGRDIVHVGPDGKTCLIQCKRYTGKVGDRKSVG